MMSSGKWQDNKPHLGTFCEIPSPLAANIIAKTGMDFLIFDLEHGAIDLQTIQSMIFAAQAEDTLTMVRVSEKNIGQILPVLDTGVDGIMIPHVEVQEDIDQIMAETMFSPLGQRGFNPFTRGCEYQSVNQDFLHKYNDRLCISVIVESLRGLENLDVIASHPKIDVVYLGQYDLSISMGFPGELENPLLTQKMEQALDCIRKHNKMAGCMVHSVDAAQSVMRNGYEFIVFKVDTNVLYLGYRSFLQGVKSI